MPEFMQPGDIIEFLPDNYGRTARGFWLVLKDRPYERDFPDFHEHWRVRRFSSLGVGTLRHYLNEYQELRTYLKQQNARLWRDGEVVAP